MIAEASLPPFSTTLFLFGALLMLLSLAGQVTIKEAKVGIREKRLRLIAGVIGFVLISVSLWVAFAPPNISQSTPTATTTPSPLTPRQSPQYKELAGRWTVWEQVSADLGGYEIIWSYDATVLGNTLSMQGKKISIKDMPPTESEKAAVSVYSLTLNGNAAEGTSDEKNSRNEVLHAILKLQFADNLQSFSGTLRMGGKDVSTLVGTKQ